MKKSIMLLMLVTAGFFCFGQNDSVYVGNSDSVRTQHATHPETKGLTDAGLAKAIEDGTIYNSASPYHNDLHEFTYLVVMRDYCTKTLSHMHETGEVNKKLSRKLKKELSNAQAKVTSAKYKGLKIESDYYELFLKNIHDQFKP